MILEGKLLNYGVGFEEERFCLINFFDIENNRYYVSTYGRIFDIQQHQLVNIIYEKGYNTVLLKTENLTKKKVFRVNILVATAFIPKTQEDINLNNDYVVHKDKISTNDYYMNLYWGSNLEQKVNRLELESIFEYVDGVTHANKHNRTYYPDRLINDICDRLRSGMSIRDCCFDLGIELNTSLINLVKTIYEAIVQFG